MRGDSWLKPTTVRKDLPVPIAGETRLSSKDFLYHRGLLPDSLEKNTGGCWGRREGQR